MTADASRQLADTVSQAVLHSNRNREGAVMPKGAAFTVDPGSDLRHALVAEAEAAKRSPAEIVRDLIDNFVSQQRDARAHGAWFRAEVEQALREAVL